MLMLKEMEYVYAVYEEQSFSKAARKLYLSQPALSAAVRRAEAEIHTPIFDRSTNPIRLTAAGSYYIDAVKRILDIRQEMESYFDTLAGECQGAVKVGAASFFCAHVLPDIAEEFQRQYPAWRASLLEVNAPDLYPCLQSGTIDLSLSVEAADPHLFHSTVWHEEQILLAVPAAFSVNRGLEEFQLTAAQVREGAHLQENFPAVDLSRFAQEPFLLLKQGNDLNQRAYKLCRNAGFVPKTSVFLTQMMTAYYLVCEGQGVSFLRSTIPEYVAPTDSVVFYQLRDPMAMRPIYLSYLKRRTNPVQQKLIDFMWSRSLLEDRPGER